MSIRTLVLSVCLCLLGCDDNYAGSRGDVDGDDVGVAADADAETPDDDAVDTDDDAVDTGDREDAPDTDPGCIAKVSLGTQFACALTRDDKVWCWGAGDLGQLGDGRQIDSDVPVLAMDGATDIVTGCQHTCALHADKTLWCWGRNASGNLGHPGVQEAPSPVQVVTDTGEPFTDVETVAAGCAYTCAVRRDDTVWCWGQNNTGQIGDGTELGRDTPVQVLSPEGQAGFTATALAGGGFHTCARRADGTVWCWGRNDYGHLGDGTGEASLVPVMADIEDVVEVSLGFSHSCARKADGTVWCWGMMDDPLAGPAAVALDTLVPQELFAGARSVVVDGATHVCAVDNQAALWCWGRTNVGQLGDGSTAFRAEPVATLLTSVRSVGAAQLNTCATGGDGTLWCWGAGDRGQLGADHRTGSPEPVPIDLACE